MKTDQMFFNKANKKVKCFICNKIGHFAKDCRVKKSVKCFNCNKFVHCAKDCKYPRQTYEKDILNAVKEKERDKQFIFNIIDTKAICKDNLVY